MENVFRKVQRDERFAGILSITVDAERDSRGATERAAEADDAEEDGWHDPLVFLGRAPAEAHESDTSGECDWERHDEAELRLVDAAVPTRHVADDDVADFAGDGGAEDAADEGAQVDEAGAEGAEVVAFFGAVDVRDGFGEDDEPADAEGVDHRAPEHGRVGEEDEGPEGDVQPAVVAETAVPGLEGLGEGFGGLGFEECGVSYKWLWGPDG